MSFSKLDRISGVYLKSDGAFKINCQFSLQKDFANLHSHQSCIKVPISPHLHQHYMLPVLYIFGNMIDERCYEVLLAFL